MNDNRNSIKPKRDFEYISSKDNERVKLFSKLSNSKYRSSCKLFLAEGVKLTREAAAAGLAEYILIRERDAERDEVLSLVNTADKSVKLAVLSEGAFGKITTEAAPQGVISVVRFPDFHASSRDVPAESLAAKRCIAVDSVRDPGNLGAILRSALAFGTEIVIISSCADIYNTKTVRASMGALFHEKIVLCADLAGYLDSMRRTRRVLGAALRDDCLTLGEYDKRPDDVIVIGNEGTGITDKVAGSCTDFVKIPMGELSESLNAAAAASVFMWEYSKL